MQWNKQNFRRRTKMTEKQNRLARELDNREEVERPKSWQPAQVLPDPDPMDGYVFRWVRVSTLDKADARNLASKLREGYEPVKIEEQPKFKLLTDPDSRFKDNIEIGGLLLCKLPEEFVAQKRKYLQNKNDQQLAAVNNNLMRENDPRMPLFSDSKSSVSKRSFGDGK